MPEQCPDHTLSRWMVESAFDNGNTLAIITEWDGMAVWELGLRPEDDGFRTMGELARRLCNTHNSVLERSGRPVREESESVPLGFAGDFCDREWEVSLVRPGGGPECSGIRAAGGGIAAVLGSFSGLYDNADISSVARGMANLHNSLLMTRR